MCLSLLYSLYPLHRSGSAHCVAYRPVQASLIGGTTRGRPFSFAVNFERRDLHTRLKSRTPTLGEVILAKHLAEVIIRRPIRQYHRLLHQLVPLYLRYNHDPERPVQEGDGEDAEPDGAVGRVPKAHVAGVAPACGWALQHDEEEDVDEPGKDEGDIHGRNS